MIIKDQIKDIEIIGENTSKQATISASKMAKLQYLLTKGLYKEPITAVIAEWTNNAVDSLVQAGKDPIENPVIVSIGRNSNGQMFFTVEDKGVGLDKEDFENVCMNYLESTKETNNAYIGAFGLGMKSFLSLSRPATFTCRKNGKERIYLVYEGPEFVNYDLISEKDTTEENGVIAELTIKDYTEYNTFIANAKQKLAYYDTVVLIINESPIINTIYRNELFQWSSQNTRNLMHLCLKDVYYNIDWDALGITAVSFPVALRFGLDSGITPTPSRESYITTEETKVLIIKRIKEVADWFVNKYNSEQRPYPDLLSAYKYIGLGSFNTKINGQTFTVNNIMSHSSGYPVKLEIDNIELQSPSFYQTRITHLLEEYAPVCYKDNWTVKIKRIYRTTHNQLTNNYRVVLVEGDFRGNMKEYLLSKYTNNTLFVKKSFTRQIGTSKETHSWTSYRHVCGLEGTPKREWRERIKEWQLVASTLISKFVDETKVVETKEYIEFVEEKRQEMIKKRQATKKSGGGLNKQAGDVTLAYSYKHKQGVGFQKKAFPITSLQSNQFLTVYFTESSDEIKGIIDSFKSSYIRFALVGKKEVNKIPNYSQFITIDKFMSRDSKPFMRLASSIIFKAVIDECRQLQKIKNAVFANCISQMDEDIQELEKYVEENNSYVDNTIKQYIIDIADEKGLYDKSLWDVYMRVREGLKKYDFVTCLAKPPLWDVENIKKYKRLINQMLLFRRKYYNDLPGEIEITYTPKKEVDDTQGELVDEELETV